MQEKRAQGALEYLLLIGGAVLVAVVSISLLTSIGPAGKATGETAEAKAESAGESLRTGLGFGTALLADGRACADGSECEGGVCDSSSFCQTCEADRTYVSDNVCHSECGSLADASFDGTASPGDRICTAWDRFAEACDAGEIFCDTGSKEVCSSGTCVVDLVAPAAPSAFSAADKPSSSDTIKLDWTNPGDSDFDKIKILRKTGSYPSASDDPTADIVYEQTGETPGADKTFDDFTGANTNGTTFYYNIWAFDRVLNESASRSAQGIPLGTLNGYCGANSHCETAYPKCCFDSGYKCKASDYPFCLGP